MRQKRISLRIVEMVSDLLSVTMGSELFLALQCVERECNSHTHMQARLVVGGGELFALLISIINDSDNLKSRFTAS